MDEEKKEQLQQEVVRRYENLSDELKRAMMSVSSAEIIYEVGRKHGLDVEKIGILAEEVGYIMLGMVPPSGFISDLKDLLEIEENKAKEIAQEINHKIFLPIREEMKRTYGTSFSEETGASGQQPTSNFQPSFAKATEDRQPPIPPAIPSRPQPPYQFGQGPAPFQTRPSAPFRPIPPPIPPRPIPPPIFSQPKEISRAGEVQQPTTPPSLKASEGAAPPPPGLPTEKLETVLPEVEEE